MRKLLWCYCSPVCGLPPGRYEIWFYHDCAILNILLWLLLCLWRWGVFFMGSSILLLMVVQQLVVILVLSQEEMNASPSTLPSWTESLFNILNTFSLPISICLSVYLSTYLPIQLLTSWGHYYNSLWFPKSANLFFVKFIWLKIRNTVTKDQEGEFSSLFSWRWSFVNWLFHSSTDVNDCLSHRGLFKIHEIKIIATEYYKHHSTF